MQGVDDVTWEEFVGMCAGKTRETWVFLTELSRLASHLFSLIFLKVRQGVESLGWVVGFLMKRVYYASEVRMKSLSDVPPGKKNMMRRVCCPKCRPSSWALAPISKHLILVKVRQGFDKMGWAAEVLMKVVYCGKRKCECCMGRVDRVLPWKKYGLLTKLPVLLEPRIVQFINLTQLYLVQRFDRVSTQGWGKGLGSHLD